jgi:hypothetical protein|tara:strand:- start:286 stop:708 length:423 start_codon:yes stop_codon:yes gene_type:complete
MMDDLKLDRIELELLYNYHRDKARSIKEQLSETTYRKYKRYDDLNVTMKSIVQFFMTKTPNESFSSTHIVNTLAGPKISTEEKHALYTRVHTYCKRLQGKGFLDNAGWIGRGRRTYWKVANKDADLGRILTNKTYENRRA